MTNTKLNPVALGYTGAILSTICMLLLSILGRFGLYLSGVEQMQKWHLFFSLSIGGIIAGIIEAAAVGFIVLYAFGWLYNKFV